MPPTLVQLRDQLGRQLIRQPNHALLHGALRVVQRAVERRGKLNRAQRLAAARAVALALDAAMHGTQLAGEATPMVSDALDPQKVPELGWWEQVITWYSDKPQLAREDPLLDFANALDSGLAAVRDGSDEAVLHVANTLDRAYEAVGESASNFGRAALDAAQKTSWAALLPAGIAVALLVAFGFARHGHAPRY